MAMVGCADGHRVDVLAHLVEHLAEIKILLGFRPADRRKVQALLIDITDGNDVPEFARFLRIAGSLAADADAGELNFFVSRSALAGGDAAEGPIARPETADVLRKRRRLALRAMKVLLDESICETNVGRNNQQLHATRRSLPACSDHWAISLSQPAAHCNQRKFE